jgi:hypothetical protein
MPPASAGGDLHYQLFHEEYNLVNFIIQAFLLQQIRRKVYQGFVIVEFFFRKS